MKELRNTDTIWSMSDTAEASVVNRGNNKIPHPLEQAISEANFLGYQIGYMDFVKVIPKDEREKEYESPAILLANNENQNFAAIVQTLERLGHGRLYHIVNYEEIKD